MLITSGLYPGSDNEKAAWKALENSIEELCAYAGTLRILLEPGDRTVDAKQLAGPTADVVKMAERVLLRHSNFGLVMDLSHIAQLGEDPETALKLAKPYCNHIHLANCILVSGHALYGDKHPLFAEKDASYTLDKIKLFARFLFAGYAKDLTVSIEIIFHGTDQTDYMQQVIEEETRFSQM